MAAPDVANAGRVWVRSEMTTGRLKGLVADNTGAWREVADWPRDVPFSLLIDPVKMVASGYLPDTLPDAPPL